MRLVFCACVFSLLFSIKLVPCVFTYSVTGSTGVGRERMDPGRIFPEKLCAGQDVSLHNS